MTRGSDIRFMMIDLNAVNPKLERFLKNEKLE